MKVAVLLSALIEAALATTCFSPTIFTTQNQLLRKATFDNQLECDKQCAADTKCVAYSVNRLSDHVLCGFLGQEVDWTICAKPARVYKKVECAGFPGNGFVAGATWSKNGASFTWSINVGESLDSPQFRKYNTNGKTLKFTVANGCEVHMILSNKTIVVHEVAKNPNDASLRAEFSEDFNVIENAWGYCS